MFELLCDCNSQITKTYLIKCLRRRVACVVERHRVFSVVMYRADWYSK